MGLQEIYLETITGPHRNPLLIACRSALWLPGKLNETIVRLRNRGYERNLLKHFHAEAPVISVGNITAGGTGKTPLVIWLAQYLISRGRNPAVLSRGYGKGSTQGGNDENTMLRRRLPGTPIVENANRTKGAETATGKYHADVLLLDDGFQHRRLARDLDIVLLDATTPLGGGQMLPAGLLREPATGLRRADAIMLTKTDLVTKSRLQEIKHEISALAPETPLFTSEHHPVALHPVGNKFGEKPPETDLRRLKGNRWAAFCAIGNPRSFRMTLEKCGAELSFFRAFRDHHNYKKEEIERILSNALKYNCKGVIITEKDAVKIKELDIPSNTPPLYYIEIKIDIKKTDELTDMINKTLILFQDGA